MENNVVMKNICRLCLKGDIRMCFIKDTYLQDVYEKITNIELNSNCIQTLCYLCVNRLKHCHLLIQQALTTDRLLRDALQCGLEINNIECTQTYKLSVSSTINISLDPVEFEVKEETRIKEELKESREDGSKNAEKNSCQIGDKSNDHFDTGLKELDDLKADFDVKDSPSDSEDDVPLKNISMKQNMERESDSPVKIKKLKKFSKETKVDAQELILDEEQQLNEMLQRSKSLNYINSPYKCDLCYKGFLDPTAFGKHKEKHDEISGPHECRVCHLRYLTPKALRAHTSAAHARRYACNTCAHRSHTKHQAKAHEQWHKGHTYPCKPCGRSFSAPTSYLSHVRAAHAGAHACRQCGESFARAHGLRMHASKAHRHAPKPNQEPDPAGFCADCNIHFTSSEAKTRHILISKRHAVFKDDTCVLCAAAVAPPLRAAHRRRHVRALLPEHAPPALLLRCEQCEATFPSRAKLQSHVKRVHLGLKYNKNIVCEICGKKCTSNATLRYHQRRHTGEKPHACELCARRFLSREQLRIHARTHSGERPYACALCGNRFSQKPALNRHYRVHTGAKPYECHVCNKPFSQSNSLKTHIRTVHLRLPPNKKKREDNLEEKSAEML